MELVITDENTLIKNTLNISTTYVELFDKLAELYVQQSQNFITKTIHLTLIKDNIDKYSLNIMLFLRDVELMNEFFTAATQNNNVSDIYDMYRTKRYKYHVFIVLGQYFRINAKHIYSVLNYHEHVVKHAFHIISRVQKFNDVCKLANETASYAKIKYCCDMRNEFVNPSLTGCDGMYFVFCNHFHNNMSYVDTTRCRKIVKRVLAEKCPNMTVIHYNNMQILHDFCNICDMIKKIIITDVQFVFVIKISE